MNDPANHPAGDLAAITSLLNDLDCHTYTLHVTDTGFWKDRSPDIPKVSRIDIRLTIIGRTMFHDVCQRLGVKTMERVVNVGQRSWWAEADTDTRRLLIEGISFQHHDDWE